MLKKEEVFVRVSSEKKARKLKELLGMFNERLFDEDVVDEALQNGWDVEFYHNKWLNSNDTLSKTKVSLKELRNILAVEKLSKAKENTWYKLDDDVYQFNEKGGIGYGLFKDEWVDGMAWLQNENLYDYVEATSKEVEQALIKEAKSRGLVEGVHIKSKWIPNSEKSIFSLGGVYTYCANKLSSIGGGCTYTLYENGKWAEVVKPEKSLEERVKELENAVFGGIELKSTIDGDKIRLVLERTKSR